jgi:DNA-binding response OmpR family regulator
MANILLVEDDQILLDLLTVILTRENHQLMCAHDGLEAMEMLATHTLLQIIITDISMPRVHGLDLIKSVRKSHQDMKIIAISGAGVSGNTNNLTTALAYGADIAVEKLFLPSELVTKINAMIGNKF